MNLAGIIRESIVDGPGIRFAVYCQGCPHGCPGCHNPGTHAFGKGKDTSIDTIMAEIKKNPLLRGVTFTGGEPLCQPEGLLSLTREIKKQNPNLDIVIFTGYTFEELQEMMTGTPAIEELLTLSDILVDGKYEEAERDLTLRFRGSRNQRIIDLPASLNKGKAVPVEEYMTDL